MSSYQRGRLQVDVDGDVRRVSIASARTWDAGLRLFVGLPVALIFVAMATWFVVEHPNLSRHEPVVLQSLFGLSLLGAITTCVVVAMVDYYYRYFLFVVCAVRNGQLIAEKRTPFRRRQTKLAVGDIRGLSVLLNNGATSDGSADPTRDLPLSLVIDTGSTDLELVGNLQSVEARDLEELLRDWLRSAPVPDGGQSPQIAVGAPVRLVLPAKGDLFGFLFVLCWLLGWFSRGYEFLQCVNHTSWVDLVVPIAWSLVGFAVLMGLIYMSGGAETIAVQKGELTIRHSAWGIGYTSRYALAEISNLHVRSAWERLENDKQQEAALSFDWRDKRIYFGGSARRRIAVEFAERVNELKASVTN